ncbi:MAG: hypothetical protein ACP5KN_03760, partial [Armatimonadota bacterium]
INPEDIAVNALALRGLDPGLRSVAVPSDDGPMHVTAPGDLTARRESGRLVVEVRYVPGQVLYVTLAPVATVEGLRLEAEGEGLTRRERLEPGETGWAWDEDLAVLAAGVRADERGRALLVQTLED